MVLRPRWPQRCPRAVKHLVPSLTQDANRFGFDVLGVEEVDVPAAVACEFSEHFAVHDGVGAALIWHATLDGDVLGEVGGPGSERHRDDRFGQRRRELVKRCGGRPDHRRPHVRHQLRKSVIVETFTRPVEEVWAALVVDWRSRQAGLDQFNPPSIHHLVVGRGRDGHSPAEVMGDSETHATDCAWTRGTGCPCIAGWVPPVTLPARRGVAGRERDRSKARASHDPH